MSGTSSEYDKDPNDPSSPIFKEVQDLLYPNRSKQIKSFLRREADFLKGHLGFNTQQIMIGVFIAASASALIGMGDALIATNGMEDDAKQAAVIKYPQPSKDAIDEARGYLAGRHIVYYDPDQPDSDPKNSFNEAYKRGLVAADSSIQPYLNTLDDARFRNVLVNYEVDKHVGSRRFIDRLLEWGGSGVAAVMLIGLWIENRGQSNLSKDKS